MGTNIRLAMPPAPAGGSTRAHAQQTPAPALNADSPQSKHDILQVILQYMRDEGFSASVMTIQAEARVRLPCRVRAFPAACAPPLPSAREGRAGDCQSSTPACVACHSLALPHTRRHTRRHKRRHTHPRCTRPQRAPATHAPRYAPSQVLCRSKRRPQPDPDCHRIMRRAHLPPGTLSRTLTRTLI